MSSAAASHHSPAGGGTVFRAVFRADASARIGVGHVMRCMTLADRLAAAGWRCDFLCAEIPDMLERQLRRRGHDVMHLIGGLGEQADARAACMALAAEGRVPDVIVCDHYGLGAEWENTLRQTGARLLALDDLPRRRHDCDILLDVTYGREPDEYAQWLPAHAQALTGSTYALLRPEFARLRHRSLARRDEAGQVQTLVVALGGADPDNVTGRILEAIGQSGAALDGIRTDVILGAAAAHLEEVRAQVAAMGGSAVLHVDTPDMAHHLTAADIAIGAAGGMTWERCCLGVPTLMVVLADNQADVAAQMQCAGAAIRLEGDGSAGIATQIAALAADPERCQRMSQKARAICDGHGAARVAEVVLGYTTPSGEPVSLREVRPADVDTLHAWQCDPVTRRHARVSAPPTYAEHTGWFQKRLAQAEWPMHFVLAGETPVGMVRLDPLETDSRDCEVSILIAPDRHGQGLGRMALALLRLYYPDITVHAHVLPENQGSQRLFETAGYQRTDHSNFVLRARTL